jgi:hypothetical protein
MRNYKCLCLLGLCVHSGFSQAKKATAKQPVTAPIVTAAVQGSLHLGRYELYSGIPSMYLGHFILLDNGKYKVAFDTDENNYEVSNYIYHEDTKTIEWVNGLFKNNNWDGKLVSTDKGFRIQFNKATFAESK